MKDVKRTIDSDIPVKDHNISIKEAIKVECSIIWKDVWKDQNVALVGLGERAF